MRPRQKAGAASVLQILPLPERENHGILNTGKTGHDFQEVTAMEKKGVKIAAQNRKAHHDY